ncbi:MAG: hypothetical protein ACKV1O_06185, partial [Saprospiraceae bacterium]
QVIRYAIEQWRIQNNLATVNYHLVVNSAPNASDTTTSLSIGFYVFHQPTQPYVALDPNLSSTLTGYPNGPQLITADPPLVTAYTIVLEGREALTEEFLIPCNTYIRVQYGARIGLGNNPANNDNWYNLYPSLDQWTQDQTISQASCTDKIESIVCTDKPVAVCQDAVCESCSPGFPGPPLCSAAESAATEQELNDLDALMTGMTAANVQTPTFFYLLRFCGGAYRYVLREELSQLTVPYVLHLTVPVPNTDVRYRIGDDQNGPAQIDGLSKVLQLRPGNNSMRIDTLPQLSNLTLFVFPNRPANA